MSLDTYGMLGKGKETRWVLRKDKRRSGKRETAISGCMEERNREVFDRWMLEEKGWRGSII